MQKTLESGAFMNGEERKRAHMPGGAQSEHFGEALVRLPSCFPVQPMGSDAVCMRTNRGAHHSTCSPWRTTVHVLLGPSDRHGIQARRVERLTL